MMKVQLLLLIELFVSCSEFSDKISMTDEVAEHINLLKASIVSNEGRDNKLFIPTKFTFLKNDGCNYRASIQIDNDEYIFVEFYVPPPMSMDVPHIIRQINFLRCQEVEQLL